MKVYVLVEFIKDDWQNWVPMLSKDEVYFSKERAEQELKKENRYLDVNNLEVREMEVVK